MNDVFYSDDDFKLSDLQKEMCRDNGDDFVRTKFFIEFDGLIKRANVMVYITKELASDPSAMELVINRHIIDQARYLVVNYRDNKIC